MVDLTRVLAGPLCTMWLGDMGADVIKVERPFSGDDTRAWGPPFAGAEAAYYLGVNRNKRSLTLDLGQERGREVLTELIRGADVVLDNFKIGTLDRWGLTDDWYEAEAPAAVRATISGYGSTGPKAAMPGYDFILQAETGLMAITGEPEGESMKLGVAIVDVCTGMLAAMTVLAALAARRRTGKGQRIEMSLHDTGLQMLANVAANHLVSGAEAVRYGNGHPNIVPYRTYPASDGELAVTVGNDAQFARFARVMGCEEWASDDRFTRNADRVANRDLLDGLIRDRMVTRTRAEWSADLEAEGIPCGPINSVAEALASRQTMARGMVTTVEHPTAGELALTGVPFKMFGTPAAIRRPPPTLGQHSREVLAEMGLDAAAISELVAAGVTTLG
ncbi:MAG: CoA transferase [Acidimicrobiaceae bacterium]|nr:CoA transferase [Acidimicrobiaceae bacterium]MXZ98538.1 CoA transferase [Acidimicrobiaceae bacterium]MYE75592.1 CoA transferase [Acidimicrobiaceae bacterium]MYE96025.1 CoA transferase [Acidimicrobiaceae bacterium]MYH44663.1 CoA transferase [Acidimicrobiaceae bacterium]